MSDPFKSADGMLVSDGCEGHPLTIQALMAQQFLDEDMGAILTPEQIESLHQRSIGRSTYLGAQHVEPAPKGSVRQRLVTDSLLLSSDSDHDDMSLSTDSISAAGDMEAGGASRHMHGVVGELDDESMAPVDDVRSDEIRSVRSWRARDTEVDGDARDSDGEQSPSQLWSSISQSSPTSAHPPSSPGLPARILEYDQHSSDSDWHPPSSSILSDQG
jgi:hypothetical protein